MLHQSNHKKRKADSVTCQPSTHPLERRIGFSAVSSWLLPSLPLRIRPVHYCIVPSLIRSARVIAISHRPVLVESVSARNLSSPFSCAALLRVSYPCPVISSPFSSMSMTTSVLDDPTAAQRCAAGTGFTLRSVGDHFVREPTLTRIPPLAKSTKLTVVKGFKDLWFQRGLQISDRELND